jgi:hypothetical protein
MPDLSVADNISITSPPRRFGLIDAKAQRRRAEALLAEIGCADVNPLMRVRDLPLSRRQMVEIAKALGQRPQLLILDEATSALASPDVEKVYAMLARLKSEGVTILGGHLRRKCDSCEIEIITAWPQAGDRNRRRYNSRTAAGAVSTGRSKSTAGTRKKWRKVDGAPPPAVSAVFPPPMNGPCLALTVSAAPLSSISILYEEHRYMVSPLLSRRAWRASARRTRCARSAAVLPLRSFWD